MMNMLGMLQTESEFEEKIMVATSEGDMDFFLEHAQAVNDDTV